MAIIKLGGGVAAASGSLGGITFSRNRGGPYIRSRVVPVNPNTPQQAAIRGFVSQLTSLWVNTLTQALRDTWNLYALNVLLPNPLGEPRNVGGLGMYIRSNVPRLQASLPRVDPAPIIFDLGDYTVPALGSLTPADTSSVSFTNTDAWANEDAAGMILYGSRPQNASINFFKGPYRLFDVILGDAITPPTSPQVGTWPFIVGVGQRAFMRAQVTRADGRLSADFRTFQLVA